MCEVHDAAEWGDGTETYTECVRWCSDPGEWTGGYVEEVNAAQRSEAEHSAAERSPA